MGSLTTPAARGWAQGEIPPTTSIATSTAEDFGLLGGELLLGEYALVLQLGEFLELLYDVAATAGLRWRSTLDVAALLLVGALTIRHDLSVALGEALRLPPLNPAAHRGRSPGYHSRSRHPSQ
jgi:hypothetical protein